MVYASLVALGGSACSNEAPEPAAASFTPTTSGEVSVALDCRWKPLDPGDSFEWPVTPSEVGECRFSEGETLGIALFDEATGADAYAALLPCLFSDYPPGDYYFAVGDAWVAAADELTREAADRVLAGLDGELVHVTELGSGPACDDGG